MSSSALFHAHFKTFCHGLEQDAKKLRQIAENNLGGLRTDESGGLVPSQEPHFIDSLHQDVDVMEKEVNDMISKLFTVNGIQGHGTAGELYMKSKTLYEVCESTIDSLETQLAKYGYEEDPKRACRNASSRKENEKNGVNFEVKNGPLVEECDNFDGNVCNSDIDELYIDPSLMDTSHTQDCVQEPTGQKLDQEIREINGGVDVEETAQKSSSHSSELADSSIFHFDGPRTPSIADMKLSLATRGAIEIDGNNVSHDWGNATYGAVGGDSSPSSDLIIASQNDSLVMNTPVRAFSKAKVSSAISVTPPTPELINDFATCHLQEATCSIHPAVMEYLDSDRNAIKISASENRCEATDASDVAYDSDNSDEDLSAIKTKILQPRINASGAAVDNWIPLVEKDEWEAAPLSLKVQVELHVMNAGIGSLNQFISKNQSKRLESFTLDEMSAIVSNQIGNVNVNIFALCLVHLKRLDIGMEHSIRVYKVRRFY